MIYTPNWSGDLIAVSRAMFGNVGHLNAVDLGSGIPADAEARTTFLGGGRLQRKLDTQFTAVAILKRANPGGIRWTERSRATNRPLSRSPGAGSQRRPTNSPQPDYSMTTSGCHASTCSPTLTLCCPSPRGCSSGRTTARTP